MKAISHATIFKCAFVAFFPLFAITFIFSETVAAKKQQIRDEVVYEHLFSLVVSFEKQQDGWPEFFQRQTGVSENQYKFLTELASKFNDSLAGLPHNRQTALTLNYRDQIKLSFGAKEFTRFSRAFRTNFLSSGGAPCGPGTNCYSEIYVIDEVLSGFSRTHSHGFAEPSGIPEICSTSATMSGPGVSVSDTKALPPIGTATRACPLCPPITSRTLNTV